MWWSCASRFTQLCMSIEEATRKLLLSVAGSARLFNAREGAHERRTQPHAQAAPVVPKVNPKALIFYARWDHASTGEMSRVRAVVDTKSKGNLNMTVPYAPTRRVKPLCSPTN